MSRRCSELSCPLMDQDTDNSECPLCGRETRSFDAATVEAALNEKVGDASVELRPNPPRVIFEPADNDDIATRRKRRRRFWVGLSFPAGEVVLCIVLAVNGYLPVVFVVGAILWVQAGVIGIRANKLVGPVIDDPVAQSRIIAPLTELCLLASCALPRVSMRRTRAPAGVVRRHGNPTLTLSPQLFALLDASALRAIISHEVVHIKRNDFAAARALMLFITMVPYTVGALAIWTIGHNSNIAFALWIVFLGPSIRLLSIVAGLVFRSRETRADLEGARAIDDPEAMIRGLQTVYGFAREMRNEVFGTSMQKWLLFPYSIRSTTHPSLDTRIARLRALTSVRSSTS